MVKSADINKTSSNNQSFVKKLEFTTKELEKAKYRLKELEKQKEEFISMAAHEMRAPMTAVKGYLSMVIEGDAGEIPQKVRDYLADASAISDRVIRLVNNMLNVSRIEEGRVIFQKVNVSLVKIAKSVYDQSKLEADRKNLKFSIEVPRGLNETVKVDPDRVLEVVANLVSNAIKYTDQGSIVIQFSQPKKNIVRLEVIDTGPGISKEEQKKLFRKFYRVKSTIGKTIGTGLGLYICKLIVGEFGGKIGLISKLDKGSTFWFELPLSETNNH